MSNFILGIEADIYNLDSLIHMIIQYQLFWGFAIGFFVATLVYAFIISDHPRHVPIILMHKPADSFRKIYGLEKEGNEHHFSFYEKMANSIRWIFSLSILIFMVIVLIAILQK